MTVRLLVCVVMTGLLAALPAAAGAQTSVRITSPLGRTGVPGVIRVVAQVQTAVGLGIVPVHFYVDGVSIGDDLDGPPYVVEWEDVNPYEAREIRVDVADGSGGIVSDTVKLPALEVIEETSVSSVLIEATVLDGRGRYVSTLGKDDFRLAEDGVPHVLDLAQLQTLPTTFTLLVDSSQSLHRRIGMVKAAARRLASRLRPGDNVIVAPFRTTIESTTGPTNDARTIAEAIDAIGARGGTAILDALATVPEMFAHVEGRHVVVLLTDGYDEQSATSYDDAMTALQHLQATVYVVGIGGVAGISLKGETLLKRIAAQMGGRAFFPIREEQLPDVHAAVAADAFNRYILSYTPQRQDADGTFRAITLTTPYADYRVRAREGYFAPRPPPVRPTIEFSASYATPAAGPLSARDLIVVEDGVVQRVESFEEAVSPISIAMVFDASGSMRRALPVAQAAARTFVTSLRPTDPLALVRFADRVVVEHEFSERRETTIEAIDRLQAVGGTALWDALHDSMQMMKQRPGRRAIVLLSDGRDENNPGTAPGSDHTLADVLALVRETETVVYAIGLGSNVDRPALERIAQLSGGTATFPLEATALDGEYRRVLETLRQRYVLGYTSTNSTRDGAWRNVVIAAIPDGVTIRSAGGYRAPLRSAPPP